MKKIAVVLLVACLALTVAGCGSSSKSSGGSASSAGGQQPTSQEQVFEGDGARATYRDAMEPTQGNIMYNFAFENNTDSTVMVSGENVVINGEYSVETLGGSAAPIAPGTTGSVSLTFGYSVQTPLQSADEIHSISCNLVMRDNDSLTTVVGSVPVAVEL